jgi:hypothetical protein
MATQTFVSFLRRSNLRTVVSTGIVLLWFVSGKQAASQVTTLDFEDFPAGTRITTQYGDRGVIFRTAFLDTDPAAHSGTRVLRSDDPADEFDQGPFVIEFTGGQTRVRFLAGNSSNMPSMGTLRAFDEAGKQIMQDGPKLVASKAFTTGFAVSSSDPLIRRIELEMGVADFEAIDDLEFEGESSPVPTEPPAVQITSPQDGAELDTSMISVTPLRRGAHLIPLHHPWFPQLP